MAEPPLYRPPADATWFAVRSDPFLTGQCRDCGHRAVLPTAPRWNVLAIVNVRFAEKKLRCVKCDSRRCILLAQEIKPTPRDFRLPI